MLDLAFLMDDPDFCSEVILERTRIVGREHGRPVYQTSRAVILGVIQPLEAQDIEALAASANGYTGEGLVLFTKNTLTAGEDDYRADRIVFEGVAYDVMQVEDWKPNGNYCRSIIRRTHDVNDPISGRCAMPEGGTPPRQLF